ncbi:heme NO-binding domain-containing protein [Ciceribacter sp. RN22]|uniref:heme NO-binding domain-containing protein n=1 Tax=Ciceribacter sp. RN22 TaxID=2954932 RepID=UPI002093C599|nr:heme NO-binding domain-containing protein [Ciceribacter sp. RN22]MCO6177019.1 heme NO-binding domain-containing protein [Ciceribacter sp. RN22]
MKGIVFIELLAMAEDTLGEGVVDDVIDRAALPSGGAYTSVGRYPCEELMTLIKGFSQQSGIAEAELQRLFGHWMMKSFSRSYPHIFAGRKGSLDMLAAVEQEIHVEVLKLHPDADLPTFDVRRRGPDALDLTYRSPRPLADFCQGLIEACISHFGETASITRTDRLDARMTEAEFRIRLGSGT